MLFSSNPEQGGLADQANDPESLKERDKVKGGGPLYRVGTNGTSKTGADAQFWSTVDPRVDPVGYAKSLNIPKTNVVNADFVEEAQIKPEYNFITRPAAPDNTPGAVNSGIGIEVVTPWGGTMNNVITPLHK